MSGGWTNGVRLRRLLISPSVIPAKAGIQKVAIKPDIRNQVRIEASGSLLPLWEKARMRVTRASAALRANDSSFLEFPGLGTALQCTIPPITPQASRPT